jgi:osmoprotectant transport system permease protein
VDFTYWETHQSDVITAAGQHIRLTLITLAISLLIAMPLGTLIARFRPLYTPLMGLLGMIYTIPSLAFLAVLIQYVGIGERSALIALVAYAQFILVRNVVVGLKQVDPMVLDAARGMGMSPVQILFKIEYPLALPVILGGVRIATVATIAITTIAYLDDAGGLGRMLFDGINLGSNSEIEVGAVAVSFLAIAADIILRLLDRLLPATRARAVAAS